MKVKSDYVLREVANQYIVVPTGASSVDFNGIITLNKSGSELFKLLENEITQEDLINHLLENYHVSEGKAFMDVEAFIQKLERNNILENN
jgi:hypothetical protein